MLPRKRALDVFLTLALFAVLAAACAGGTPIDVGPPGGDDDDDDIDATFATGAFVALRSENCALAGCHIPSGPQGGLALPDAAGTLTVAAAHAALLAGGLTGPAVSTASPNTSLILTKGSNTVTHTGLEQWTDGDETYQIVLAWITSGAQMN